MFKSDCTMSSYIDNYYTLSNEYNWEVLCIRLRNQQTCTSYNHNSIRGGRFSIRFLHIFHHRVANATQVLLCKSNRQKLENMEKESNDTHVPLSSVDDNMYLKMLFSIPIFGVAGALCWVKLLFAMKLHPLITLFISITILCGQLNVKNISQNIVACT